MKKNTKKKFFFFLKPNAYGVLAHKMSKLSLIVPSASLVDCETQFSLKTIK